MVSTGDNNVNDADNASSLHEDSIICAACGENLCLRKKTINLALGNTEIMYCLNCLGVKENKSAEEILAKIRKYIMARECFQKEWIKYKDVSYCPMPESCIPDTCFLKQ